MHAVWLSPDHLASSETTFLKMNCCACVVKIAWQMIHRFMHDACNTNWLQKVFTHQACNQHIGCTREFCCMYSHKYNEKFRADSHNFAHVSCPSSVLALAFRHVQQLPYRTNPASKRYGTPSGTCCTRGRSTSAVRFLADSRVHPCDAPWFTSPKLTRVLSPVLVRNWCFRRCRDAVNGALRNVWSLGGGSFFGSHRLCLSSLWPGFTSGGGFERLLSPRSGFGPFGSWKYAIAYALARVLSQALTRIASLRWRGRLGARTGARDRIEDRFTRTNGVAHIGARDASTRVHVKGLSARASHPIQALALAGKRMEELAICAGLALNAFGQLQVELVISRASRGLQCPNDVRTLAKRPKTPCIGIHSVYEHTPN